MQKSTDCVKPHYTLHIMLASDLFQAMNGSLGQGVARCVSRTRIRLCAAELPVVYSPTEVSLVPIHGP